MTAAASGRLGRGLHRLFEVSLGVKALFALAEFVSGVGAWVIPPGRIRDAAHWLVAQELSEDPTDRLARAVLRLAEQATPDTQHFWALYLLGHAVIKLALVAGLALRIRAAYPASILVLIGFVLYQIERWMQTGGVSMIVLTLFDLMVIALVWREWRSMPA